MSEAAGTEPKTIATLALPQSDALTNLLDLIHFNAQGSLPLYHIIVSGISSSLLRLPGFLPSFFHSTKC
jgi:hypothetical protein